MTLLHKDQWGQCTEKVLDMVEHLASSAANLDEVGFLGKWQGCLCQMQDCFPAM